MSKLFSGVNIWAFIGPATLTLLAAIGLVALTIARAGGDPLVLARIGTLYSVGDQDGTEGYDGQFVYYIALNPNPEQVGPHLDVPAYRYQRILLPAMARVLSLGNEAALPWVLALLGPLTLWGGTWAVERLLSGWGVSRWYALTYGLWAGFTLAILVDLPEPLAFGLVAGAYLALERHRRILAWCLLGLSVFAKEVTLLFVAALILAYLFKRRWSEALKLGLVGVVPFAIFQAWLWVTFGQPGIGSGGAMGTPFEWIPFMGLLRIGYHSVPYLLAMAVVFGPTVVLPSVWGVWVSVRHWLEGERNVIVFGLLLNALVIPFLPFSTFRETGALIRLASGLMLAVLLFAAHYRRKRVLNYSLFWIVLNVFLLK